MSMARKLTILLDDEVYERLHAAAGKRRVGRYVEALVRDRLRDELESAYAAMAREEAREADAFDWAEATLEDVSDETR
jgi:predicted CopG family antitoxin